MSEQPAKNQRLEHWKRRWQEETSWSARELAKLCCGWNPDSDVLPDPAAYNLALEMIIRAVRVGDLQPIDLRVPATREEFFYGYAPLFRAPDVATWAAKRFSDFPYNADNWLEASTPAPTLATLTAPAPEVLPVDDLLTSSGATDSAGESETSESARRQTLLEGYKTATGVTAHAPIYRAADIHRPDFYKWRAGVMSRQTKTARRLEKFLREKARPPLESE